MQIETQIARITQMITPPHSSLSPLSRAEERAILTVTCLAAFLFFNSFGSIGVALPALQKQFGNSLSEIQWITLMGVVTISSLSFCFGRAGGRFGQRRLYKIGVALYAAGAGLGAVSSTFMQLLGSRFVMAVGLAMALPMSTAILAASFEPQRRGQALGLFASAIAVGRMTGPAVGGFLLQLGAWTWIFWMNFIVGLGVTLAVLKIFRGPGEMHREVFDGWGALTLLVGYPALLIALTFGSSLGWRSAPVIAGFALAGIGLVSFVWIELRAVKPLIDVTLFKQRSLAVALLTIVCLNILSYPIALAAPLYLQNVLGASAMGSGFLLAVLPLSTALASPISGRLADRFDAARVSAVGMAMVVAGIAGYSRLGIGSPLAIVVGVFALLGGGIGFFTPANQKIAFAAVGREDYGVLAAMLSSFGTGAGTIGTAVAVALMEIGGGKRLWSNGAAFAEAQQFAFACLVPVGLIAIAIALTSRRRANAIIKLDH
jgi:DHA2 family methylenomycin A resistance protein-like MFS transporter